jgi:hypothetical protein
MVVAPRAGRVVRGASSGTGSGMSAVVEIVGGGFPGLVRAVEEVRRGGRVDYVEPGLRAGGAMITESFLSPFRFNLGPTLVPRPPLPSLHVLEPDPLVAVGDSVLRRDGSDSALLPALGALLGIDPASSERLEALAGALDDLVVVSGGNGLAAACLVDEILAAGSTVVEGAGDATPEPRTRRSGIGICRLFLGLRRPAAALPAHATAFGFDDIASLESRLAALREGAVDVVGFVVANDHLDANVVEPGLGSLVWQGFVSADADVDRREYASTVLASLRIDESDVVFRLVWLPDDTGEYLS